MNGCVFSFLACEQKTNKQIQTRKKFRIIIFSVYYLIDYLLFADKYKNYNFAMPLSQIQWPSVVALRYDQRKTVIIMSMKTTSVGQRNQPLLNLRQNLWPCLQKRKSGFILGSPHLQSLQKALCNIVLERMFSNPKGNSLDVV
jgi:hypothetical protein